MRFNNNFKNIISLFSSDIAVRIIGFFATVYIARVLGKDGFGVMNIGFSVLTYALILGNSGLVLLGTKKVAGRSESFSNLIGDIVGIRIVISVLIYLLSLILVFLFIDSQETRNIVLIFLLYLFPSAFLLEWFFQGNQKMGIISLGRIAGYLSYLLFVLVLVKSQFDIVMTAVAWTLGGIVNTIVIGVIFLSKEFQFDLKVKRIFKSFSLLKESFPLGLASLLSQAAIMFPIIYLGIVSTKSEVGIYSAAYKVIAFLLIFDRVFSAVFFPRIVNCARNEYEKLEELFNRILKIITVLSVSGGLIIILCGSFIITIVFGPEYDESIKLFQSLVGFFVFTLINSVFSYTLIALDKEKIYTVSLLKGLITFIISVLILYPYFGTIGIIYSLIVYEIVQLSVMSLGIKDFFQFRFLKSIVVPVLTSVLMLFPLLYVDIEVYLKILLGIIIGIPLIFIASNFGKTEFRYIKRLLI